jgi:hypothetical protein
MGARRDLDERDFQMDQNEKARFRCEAMQKCDRIFIAASV